MKDEAKLFLGCLFISIGVVSLVRLVWPAHSSEPKPTDVPTDTCWEPREAYLTVVVTLVDGVPTYCGLPDPRPNESDVWSGLLHCYQLKRRPCP